MRMGMTSQEIRQCFFDFFKSKGHDSISTYCYQE